MTGGGPGERKPGSGGAKLFNTLGIRTPVLSGDGEMGRVGKLLSSMGLYVAPDKLLRVHPFSTSGLDTRWIHKSASFFPRPDRSQSRSTVVVINPAPSSSQSYILRPQNTNCQTHLQESRRSFIQPKNQMNL